MSKRKIEISELQSDFFDFIPLSRDVQDAMLEKEVYKDSGRQIYRDDHPLLVAYREKWFNDWCDSHPDGQCAYFRQFGKWRE